eukprot:scaffold80584_cov69-Phaeocystis_antarctica.AAC.5
MSSDEERMGAPSPAGNPSLASSGRPCTRLLMPCIIRASCCASESCCCCCHSCGPLAPCCQSWGPLASCCHSCGPFESCCQSERIGGSEVSLPHGSRCCQSARTVGSVDSLHRSSPTPSSPTPSNSSSKEGDCRGVSSDSSVPAFSRCRRF